MRILFSFLLLFHAIIHLLGFIKAFALKQVPQLEKDISKPMGVIWLLTALLIVVVVALFLTNQKAWIYLALIAILFSQALIIYSWQDAKYGTIPNILILLIALAGYTQLRYEHRFTRDVKYHLSTAAMSDSGVLTDADLLHLPPIVRKYLHFCQVVGQPKVHNFKVVMEGQMRDKKREYFTFESVQYNFLEDPARLFFMRGKMFGMSVPGYHKYSKGKASMNISLFGIFPVVQIQGEVLDKTETVTLFNDICLMAPAALIDQRISWKPVNDTIVSATYDTGRQSITAELHFLPDGRLINFVSQDRTEVGDMMAYPFHTPVQQYDHFNQYRLVSQGKGIWIYPDGPFTYGIFNLKSIEYNLAGAEN